MQITDDPSISGRKVVFDSILDEIPGGAGLNVTRLDYLTANKEYIQAGTPVYFDPATRIAEVCKSALAIDGGGATTPRVNKLHHFKVGDLINDGTTSAYISAIDTTETAYDVLTVNAAITYAAGTKYAQGAASGTDATLLFTPNGLVKSPTYIKEGNADVPVVTIGSVREDALTHVLPDAYKIALRGGASQTTASKSMITVN